MTTAAAAGEKRCKVCGKDVRQTKRVKDAAGDYYCTTCRTPTAPTACSRCGRNLPDGQPRPSVGSDRICASCFWDSVYQLSDSGERALQRYFPGFNGAAVAMALGDGLRPISGSSVPVPKSAAVHGLPSARAKQLATTQCRRVLRRTIVPAICAIAVAALLIRYVRDWSSSLSILGIGAFFLFVSVVLNRLSEFRRTKVASAGNQQCKQCQSLWQIEYVFQPTGEQMTRTVSAKDTIEIRDGDKLTGRVVGAFDLPTVEERSYWQIRFEETCKACGAAHVDTHWVSLRAYVNFQYACLTLGMGEVSPKRPYPEPLW